MKKLKMIFFEFVLPILMAFGIAMIVIYSFTRPIHGPY